MTLEQLSAAATQGEWEVDYEYDKDALYSGGGGCGSGFKNYFVGTDIGGKWATLFDTVNSEQKLIEEDYDEDGKNAWDEIGRANTAFIVALVNAYRTGQLVAVAIERYRHVKRGTVYEVVGEAELQMNADNLVDGSQMMVYRGEDGKLWCRHYDEFHDGRFAALAAKGTGDE